LTLTEELNAKGDLEASGGAPYLASLADGMPKVSNIEHYARIVKEKAILAQPDSHHTQYSAARVRGRGRRRRDLDNAESSIFR